MKRRTLFDPTFLLQYGASDRRRLPYSVALAAFCGSGSRSVPEDEVSIFSHVLEHEVCAYEPRGYVFGPICFGSSRRHGRRVCCHSRPFRIPSFVEPDVLPIAQCHARALVLVEDYKVFELLTRFIGINEMGILLMTGCGVPRLGTRRLARRFERECHLPVFLLTDNDTWGYWVYSVLKRGLMAPGVESDYAAIRKVSFMGVRAGDWKRFRVPIECVRPWESQWDVRLEAIRSHRWFRSKQWQRELDRFAADRCGLALRALVEHIGGQSFISRFVAPRLTRSLK